MTDDPTRGDRPIDSDGKDAGTDDPAGDRSWFSWLHRVLTGLERVTSRKVQYSPRNAGGGELTEPPGEMGRKVGAGGWISACGIDVDVGYDHDSIRESSDTRGRPIRGRPPRSWAPDAREEERVPTDEAGVGGPLPVEEKSVGEALPITVRRYSEEIVVAVDLTSATVDPDRLTAGIARPPRGGANGALVLATDGDVIDRIETPWADPAGRATVRNDVLTIRVTERHDE